MEAVYYVLKRPSVASKIDRGVSSSHLSRPVSKAVSAGGLWQQAHESSPAISHSDALYEPTAPRNSSTAVTLRSCEMDDLLMRCSPQEIHRLNCDAERQLLAAVDTSERLRLVETDAGMGQLRDGCRMLAAWNDEGTHKSALELNVLVAGLTRNGAAGLVRYIGRLSGRTGIWFGVELSPVSNSIILFNSNCGFIPSTLFIICHHHHTIHHFLSYIPDLKHICSTNPFHHRSSPTHQTAHWISTGLPSRTPCYSAFVLVFSLFF